MVDSYLDKRLEPLKKYSSNTPLNEDPWILNTLVFTIVEHLTEVFSEAKEILIPIVKQRVTDLNLNYSCLADEVVRHAEKGQIFYCKDDKNKPYFFFPYDHNYIEVFKLDKDESSLTQEEVLEIFTLLYTQLGYEIEEGDVATNGDMAQLGYHTTTVEIIHL